MAKITSCPPINKPTDRIKINQKRHRRKEKKDKLLTEWNCNLCHMQSRCKELCPPMEWIVKQVEVDPGTESPGCAALDDDKTGKWPDMLSVSEIIFSLFFNEQLAPTEIAKQLRISKRYVYQVINKGKKILLLNLQKSVHFASLNKKD